MITLITEGSDGYGYRVVVLRVLGFALAKWSVK